MTDSDETNGAEALMGRTFDTLDESLSEWIGGQHLFFVGTAPLAAEGHVNISPKGSMDTFRILGPTTVAYLDLAGSGIETTAHLRENGRIVIMFCAFDGAPKVLRLHGRGRVVQSDEPEFESLLVHFQPNDDLLKTQRSVIVVEVTRIADSCGFVVPRMEYTGDREQLFRWAEHQQQRNGDEWALKYRQANNRTSIDGLPALELPEEFEEDLQQHSSAGRAL